MLKEIILQQTISKKLKVKISAVSYLNTLPFLYGIENSGLTDQIDLQLDIPSTCAQKLMNGEVDLGLVPVAILPQLKRHYIVSDYCIGATGKVNSVLLLSDVPLEEITSVLLDYQSRTSVTLVQILARELWKINPKWVQASKGYESEIEGSTAGVIIGDRTFGLKKKYNYIYDLSEAWYELTGLPFVFAAWVSNVQLEEEFISSFNASLKNGLNNISQAIETYDNKDVSKEVLSNYLTVDIDYHLDERKLQAIEKFHNYMSTNELEIVRS